MKKWRCLVCDLVYDEAEGWPDDGIKAGTRWEDVPDDWLCPYCGVGKEDFEMVEIKSSGTAPEQAITPPVNTDPAKDPIVIIGAGMAAYNLAKQVRKHDVTTPIKIISRDDGKLYYKPSLSCMLTNKKTPDDLIMPMELSVDLLPFTEVTDIDRKTKQVVMGQESLTYGKLVFATGAGAIRPPLKGDGVDLIHTVNDLLDYRNFRAGLVGKSHVVIIGAGLIGCEFANDLLKGGMQVDVIDLSSQCMTTLLPSGAAEALERGLTDIGCRFHFENKVEEISKSGDRFTVSLSNGTTLETDLVISAVGLKPHTELADKSGLEFNRGIMVNEYLETADPDIYALGDCAEVKGQVLMYVDPLLACAKALGETLGGSRRSVRYGPMPVIVKTPACPVAVAPPAADAPGEWFIDADKNNIKAVFKSPDGEILGFALTGSYAADAKKCSQIYPANL